MNDLTPLPESLADALQQAHSYALHSKADNTRRAYTADWQHFSTWCSELGLPTLPASPAAVAVYLSTHAHALKPGTLARRLTTIAEAHRTANLESPTTHPTVRQVMAGIRRTHGTAQTGKAPVLTMDIIRMLTHLDDDRAGRRDHALVLIGYAGAFRRSELVAIDRADLEFSDAGVAITLRKSKTDQEGQGAKVAIPFGHGPTCPVLALQAWLNHGQIVDGPVFRAVSKSDRVLARRLTDRAVALILKRMAAAAGLDPATIAGHSLRAGCATQAAMNGIADRAIMKQTRHRTRAMLDRYVRDGSLFRDNAGGGLGL